MRAITSNRAYSLDALRGYAIVTMVLSGAVASGILPGWMYHAQLPPPSNMYNPAIPGITWVDLVFPFFLFAMGAAFPFSLGSKLEKGQSVYRLMGDAILRGIKLAFFAIFIRHMAPGIISSPADARAWLLTLCAFALLFPMFMRLPWEMPGWLRIMVKIGAYLIAAFMMLVVSYANDRQFSLYFSNIIILVLANMAIFGSVIYLLTVKSIWLRMGVLPFIMAIFLSGKEEGSWTAWVFEYSPLPWFYRFLYLKYLFIVLPGSVIGEYLKEWIKARKKHDDTPSNTPVLLILSIALVIMNLYGLYMRYLVLNLFVTIIILAFLFFLTRQKDNTSIYWHKLIIAGSYFLLLGLFFEPYEGGIHKDPSTYSYYFVTTGLACIALLVFSIICDIYRWKFFCRPFEMGGENPMIAYVASGMLVQPVLNLTGIMPFVNALSETPWQGFARGVILTSLALLAAMFFTRIKWFWRT